MKSNPKTAVWSIPRSTTRQNILYSIERLENKIEQMELGLQSPNANPGAATFFSKARDELMRCRATLLRDYVVKQVYIYQKLLDIQRGVIIFSSPADVHAQYLFIRRNVLAIGPDGLTSYDKKKVDEIDDFFLKGLVGDNQTAIPAKTINDVLYLSKLVDDRAAITIWNGEKLVRTSARMSIVLLAAAFVLLLLLSVFHDIKLLMPAQQGNLEKTIKLLMCVVGGVVGAGVSSFASIRKSEADGDGESSIPFLNTDWVRPVLGAIAGLIFGLVAVSDLFKIDSITVMTASAIAFGFSERLLYSVLKESSDQIGKQLSARIGQRRVRRSRKQQEEQEE